jgi:hypothetical protein
MTLSINTKLPLISLGTAYRPLCSVHHTVQPLHAEAVVESGCQRTQTGSRTLLPAYNECSSRLQSASCSAIVTGSTQQLTNALGILSRRAVAHCVQ